MKKPRDQYEISCDKRRMDAKAIHAYLTRSYWSTGIPGSIVRRGMRNAMCFGVFHREPHRGARRRQIGFCRVITDKATFAYLADVYILEEHRGKGLSKRLLKTVQSHKDLQGLRKFLLGTRDAHSLYAKFGFKRLASPQNIMEIRNPNAYRPRGRTARKR